MSGPRVKYCNPDPVERYWPNSNYGNAQILKKYSGYPMYEPIWAVLPHGVFYEDDYVYPGEALANLPAVLQWPAHRDEVWSQYKTVVPVAAPFLYAMELYPQANERKGTVVMPQHTTTLYDMEFDWWAFYDEVKKLPKPITVLMYYNDIQLDKHLYFPHLRVKCCGHVNDQNFLENLTGYLTGAEYVVSNEVGSYTYYAWAAGAAFNLIGPPPRFVLNEEGVKKGFKGVFHNSEDRHPEEKRRIAEVTDSLAGTWFDAPTSEHIAFADYYLRREAMKDPQGLLDDLNYCRSLVRLEHLRRTR